MRAICVTAQRGLEVREVPQPENPPPQHLLLKMEACTINSGDKAFLVRVPSMALAGSQYDIWGASGQGTVLAIGEGVPASYLGQKVLVYRSLTNSDHIVGCWSEFAQMPLTSCALVPADFGPPAYECSLVNPITAYAFAKRILAEGHRGILITAGTSATGKAMLGVAQALNIPTLSIVRDADRDVRALGAEHVLSLKHPNFTTELGRLTEATGATAVFDGVGASLTARLLPGLAGGSTLYSYGYLGGLEPLPVDPVVMMAKDLTIRGFSNFRSPTVQNLDSLAQALHDLSGWLTRPHFHAPIGRTFAPEQIEEAFAYRGPGKATLVF